MTNNNLTKEFEQISNSIPKNQWYYFHRNTIRNFIEYIEYLDDHTSTKVNTILTNCIADIRNNFQPKIEYSYDLMENYLRFLIPIYRSSLKFSAVPSKNAIILLSIGLLIILLLLWSNYRIQILLILIVIVLNYRSFINLKKHKAYGFCY